MEPPLCQTLSDLSHFTWSHLQTGFDSGYGQADERALMDHHLLELIRLHPSIRLAKFELAEETEIGADFEWWLDDGEVALGMRVQAKKLDLGRGAYRQLRHSGLDHAQVDQLIGKAKAGGLVPLYLFFNGPSASPGGDRCPRDPISDRGCTIARADEVKQVLEHGAPSAERIGAVSWPWRCLTCCLRQEGLGACRRAAALLERHFPLEAAGLWSEAPAYVEHLLNASGPGQSEPGAEKPDDGSAEPTATTVLVMPL